MAAAAGTSPPRDARDAALRVLADQAAAFPELAPASPETSALAPRDRAFAGALYRTTMQRWLTLRHLVRPHTTRPFERLEPRMQAVLLMGAAQLLFMPGRAAYAVVDESVTWAKRHVRPRAGGMVNAVLRRVAEHAAAGRIVNEPWRPAPDRIPLDGGTLCLAEAALPPLDALALHLEAATSHPADVVARWLKTHGREAAVEVCRQGVLNPPTIVAVEPAFEASTAGSSGGEGDESASWVRHERAGFIVWRDDHEGLVRFLAGHPARRVQDPAAAAAVETCRDLLPAPTHVLDYCAGRGTKTRQLAIAYPDAHVHATDADNARRNELRSLEPIFPNVRVVDPHDVADTRYELILLDVPCSNSGVFARRPEARYRLSDRSLRDLAALQGRLLEQARPWLTPGGLILYTTCSIEPQENQHRAAAARDRLGLRLVRERATLPAGEQASHHDGSYHAALSG